ncbi:hypothetical protein IAR50_006146 [Cryptococcus sp. DSM 104548]
MSAPPPPAHNSAAPSPVPAPAPGPGLTHTPTPPPILNLNGLPRPPVPAPAPGGPGPTTGIPVPVPTAGMQTVRPLNTVGAAAEDVGAGAPAQGTQQQPGQGQGQGQVRPPIPGVSGVSGGQFQRTFPPSAPGTPSTAGLGTRPPAPGPGPTASTSALASTAGPLGQPQASAGAGAGSNPRPSTTTTTTTTATGAGAVAAAAAEENFWAARREEEMNRRDRSLGELLVMLDGYEPLVPEEVTEYFLQKSGFDCSDPRLKRLLSLVSQKFISDLSKDAFYYSKLRVNGATGARGRPATGTDKNRVVLTMDDLSLALGEHGVNVKAPDYCTFLLP